MKKVILTAVAVVALGSFALKSNPLHTKAMFFGFINDFCFNVAINMYDAAIDGGETKLQASKIADHFYANCMSYF
ncbi:MAG: hypothetical protein RQ756_03875 [Flavobacteriaceae bacterium]|nr:hypothetical protein [Flavobacteriaceae bacterium]